MKLLARAAAFSASWWNKLSCGRVGAELTEDARSLTNQALLYDSQGRYAEAEQLYQRALAIQEETLGREHPDVARSLNNLADLYRGHGRYAEAESLYRRSLDILENR